jgi:cytochrome P450
VALTEPVMFNPFEPGFHEDPYTQYARLRAEDPVHATVLGPWVLTRYDDVFAVLRDAGHSVQDSSIAVSEDSSRRDLFEAALSEAGLEPDTDRGSHAILNLDPPDHTRIRGLMSKVFTPRRIEGLRPRIQELVDDALARVEPMGEMDLIADLAFPLPFAVISEMLGMPEADMDSVREWSGAMVKTLDPVLAPEDIVAGYHGSRQLEALLDEVLEAKRRSPADDLLSALLAVEDDGSTLSSEELRDQVVLLYLAGHETTVNLIGNGVLALLRNPDQLDRLQADPRLDAQAVDELLRYDPPVQLSRRITTAPLEIGGRTIGPGSVVLTSLASANRDPAHWGPTADRLDITREGAAQHVSFGSGSHYCLGSSLARLEAAVAIGTLVRRLPDLHLASDTLTYNGRITLRGLQTLPLTFGR